MYNNPLFLDNLDLFTEAELTVSGGDTPSLTSESAQVGKLSKIHVFVANSGPSSNVTIYIKGKPSLLSTLEETLGVFTLGAADSGTDKTGKYIEKDAIPAYIYAVAINSDASNVAEITVTLDRYR